MEGFKDYLASEYQVKDAVATDMKFAYNMTVKMDTKTKIPINMHTVTITLKFYDKDMELLKTGSVKFVNDRIPKSVAKKFVNISPDELGNRFVVIRPLVANIIKTSYMSKLVDIQNKIINLRKYSEDRHHDSIAIEDEFKGEIIQPVETQEIPKNKKKQKFDM